jgi:hypothetical protein
VLIDSGARRAAVPLDVATTPMVTENLKLI